jgi:tripartite-type tricarboxylate transporter receptor subunit TctC
MLSKRTFVAALLALGTGVLPTAVSAQPYPSRPITVIVPFPPGSNSDVVLRTLSDKLTASLGQPIVIEHRPGGAGGTVGTKAAAAASPDGHTLLFSTPGPLVIAPAVYKNLGYDAATAFTPIALIFSVPQMLAVNNAIPAKTMNELVAYAKANPGKITFASPGYGTQPHLLGEMLRLQTGIDITHAPYKGPGQIIGDLIGGQIQMNFETAALLLPHVEAGKVRALAIADDARSPQAPDLPTTAESGFPKLQATFWTGMLAPAGTPPAVIERLNGAINEALKSPELQQSLAKLSAKTRIGTPSEFASFITAEAVKWKDVTQAAKVAVD